MGFFSNIGKAFGFGGDAGAEAAEQIAAANTAAIKGVEEQFGITESNLAPFIEAGAEGFGRRAEASSFGGFSDRLDEVFKSDIFKNLVGERTKAVSGGLASAGLTRSGGGINALADIPQNVGLAIENLIFGREASLGTTGLNAALNLGSFRETKARDVAGITQGTGQAAASGILRDENTGVAGINNLASILGSFGGNVQRAGGFGNFASSFF